MKKRLIALLICIVMILSSIPMTAMADDVPEISLDVIPVGKKFDDVTEGSWYADGVYYCVDGGFMSGTSESLFSPHASMTRAMFVTMLAAYDGADLVEYTGSSFSDVAEGKWYAPAVEWAYKNGIVSGIGDGVFGYKNTVNRQEIALMLKTYLEYKGEDTTAKESFKYSRYADKEDISSWAESAVEWACGMGLFDAAGNEGDLPILKPKNTATRAQVALIMKNFDETVNKETPVLTIAGNDISLYSLVISHNYEPPQLDAANLLQRWIKNAYGVELPIVYDTTQTTEYEIILGKTDREEQGLVTVDRSAEYELSYSLTVQGNRLVLAGVVDAKRRRGTLYAAYELAELIGYNFYSDYYTIFDGKSHDIPADLYIVDDPGYEYKVLYSYGSSSVYANHEDYYSGCNWVHELANWIDPNLDGGSATPCLTDEENIQKVIDRTLALLASRPDCESVWISQADSGGYCHCENCTAIYDANGGAPSATIIALCNRICDVLDEAGYTDVKVMTLAYMYSTTPPTNMVCNDDIIVFYCTDACISCPYNSKECPINASMEYDIVNWGEICRKLYVWDYTDNFRYLSIPFPDFYNILENNRWFYEHNVRGAFNNADSSENGEFGELRCYLYSLVYRDPDITEEQFYAKMDGFLQAYYGDGWQNVRKYLDFMEEWSSKYHFGCMDDPVDYYEFKYFEANEDLLNAMWDEVEALADSEQQLNDIRISRLCCTYMILNATYYRDFQMGTEETREEWQAKAQAYYDEVIGFGVTWTQEMSTPRFNINKPPMEWM